VLIPVDEVAEISLRDERVVLRRAPDRDENDLSRQLRNLLSETTRSGRAWLAGR
jgi:hypothetical protein